MALRILKNRADAEDSDTGCFYSLGYGAVERNGLAGVAGEEQVAGSGEVEEVAEIELHIFVAGGRCADELIEVRQQQERVRLALGQLTDLPRKSLELVFLGGLTHQEIAEKLSDPLGTVKSRSRMAMIKLKEVLEGLSMRRQAEGILQ